MKGDLGYYEAINKETIKNALKRYTDMGVLLQEHHHEGDKSNQIYYLLNSEIEKEAVRCLDQPLPQGLYMFSYQFDLRSKHASPSPPSSLSPAPAAKHMYETQLWNLVEFIGQYRREGKHRRDNQLTGQRILRLAKMARDVSKL